MAMCLQPDSKFAAAYSQGVNKKQFWEPVYEDSLDLIAKMPGIAANIYRRTYKGGKQIPADPNLDWAGNLAHQMGEYAWIGFREVVQRCPSYFSPGFSVTSTMSRPKAVL